MSTKAIQSDSSKLEKQASAPLPTQGSQQVDIEHVQVEDDPREWSALRKVCFILGRCTPPTNELLQNSTLAMIGKLFFLPWYLIG